MSLEFSIPVTSVGFALDMHERLPPPLQRVLDRKLRDLRRFESEHPRVYYPDPGQMVAVTMFMVAVGMRALKRGDTGELLAAVAAVLDVTPDRLKELIEAAP